MLAFKREIASLTCLALLTFALPSRAAQKDTTPPTQPGNPSAAPASCSQINLNWDASTDVSVNGQSVSGIQGYYVYLQGNSTPLKLVAVPGTSITGLAGNTLYTFQIAAVDGSNNVSSLSVPVSATTFPCTDVLPPSVPGGVTATALDCGQVTISWQPSTDTAYPNQIVSGVQGYKLYRGGLLVKQVAGTSTIDAGLVGGTSYSFEVSAVDNVGNESAHSVAALASTPRCPPGPPTGLTGRALNCQRIDLTWTAPVNPGSGLAGYKVYRDGNFIEQVSNASFSEAAPAAAATFSYWVTTVDSLGRESVLSDPAVVSVPACPAAPASNLRINRSGTFVQVDWDGTAGALYQAQYALNFFGPWTPVDGPTASKTVTNLVQQPSALYRVAIFTNTPAYLANFAINNGDHAAPSTPPNFIVTAASDTEALLNWDPVTDTGTLDGNGQTFTSGLDRYLIYRDGVFLKSEPAEATTSSDATVVTDQQYTYSIASLDKAGNRSALASHSVLMRKQCSYTLNPTSASFSSTGGNGSFSVSAANGCSWAAQPNASWIHAYSSGNGAGTVNYTVDQNPNISPRSGAIVVGTQTFSISQAGVSCSFVIAPTGFSHGAGGESGSFGMTAPAGCAWVASSSFTWIHTTSSGNGNGTISYTIDANSGGTARSGTIGVAGQTYTVYQAGASCTYSLGSSSISYGPAATSGNVGITAPAGCSWVATTISSWIHTSSSGSGNGTISYTVDANTGSSGRSGTINAGGQAFTINQSGQSCSYSLNPTSASYGAGAQSGSFGVSSQAGCGWTATTSYGWIHTTSSGSGNGTVNYTVDANGTTSSRSGTIVVAGQTFNISQAGLPSCTYSLSASSASFGSGGGSGSVGVTTAAGCSWTASSGAGWISITSGSPGNGNGTVAYSVSANGSSSPRSGSLTIAGQNFTVNQDGVGGVDTTAPSVNMLSPGSGALLNGQAQVSCSASDNVGVSSVQFYVDNLGSWILLATQPGTGSSGNYTLSYNTTNVVNGPHNFLCRAYDGAGNSSYSLVGVTISNYNADPGTMMWAKDLGQSPLGAEAQNSSVKTDSQGNQIVVGKFSGTVNFGGTSLSSVGGYDMFMAKYSAGGSLMWIRSYGGAYDNLASSVAIDSADNIIMTGQFVGTMNLGGGVLTSGGGNSNPDMFVAKFNSSGTHLWSKTFGGAYGNYANAVVVDRNNDILIAGQYNFQVNFGGGLVQSAGGADGFVVKFSGQNGAYIWARSFGGAAYDNAEALSVDGNGDVIVSGFSTGSMDFGGGVRANNGGSDAFLAKFVGSTGAHIWSQLIGGPGNEGGEGLAIDTTGNGVLVGSFTQTITVGGVTLNAPLSTAMLIVRFDGSGRVMWAKGVGGQSSIGGAVGPRAAAVDSAGNIIVTGNATGEADFGNGVITAGTGNIFLTKYSPTGGYLWAKRFASSGWSSGTALTVDSSRNVLAAGSFAGSVDFEGTQLSTVSTLTKDAYLLKVSP